MSDGIDGNDLSQAGLAERVSVLEAEVRALALAMAGTETALEMLRAAHLAAEIRSFLASQAVRRPAPASGPKPFTIELICCAGAEGAKVTRPDLFLDDQRLDSLYAQSIPGIGAVKPNRTALFIEALTGRISRRLARRYAGRLKISPDLLTEAWLHAVEMELWQLVSVRHLARSIAATAGDMPVVIPLPTTRFSYLSHGGEGRGIVLFYLAAELQRRGVNVGFLCTDPEMIRGARGVLPLRFEPHRDLWVPGAVSSAAPVPSGEPRGVLVAAGIRGVHHILDRHPELLKIQSSYVFDPSFGLPQEAVIDVHHLPVALTIPLSEAAGVDFSGGGRVFSVTLLQPDLGEYLCAALGGATVAAAKRAEEIAQRHNLTEAHICDHPFFEAAIVAHAVRARGGRVVLWPHGGNPSLPWVRKPGSVDAVYCALNSMAETWRAVLPGTPVTVVPYLWLPRYRGPRPHDGSAPLSVVIISNECSYSGLDLMDRSTIEQSYRNLFQKLDGLSPEVRYLCRPRSQINLNWLWRLSGHRPDFGVSPLGPMLIDLPNMVFLFVGQLSSAVFEGIGRGIPSLYVRADPDVEEYAVTAIPDCLPTGSVDLIIDQISRCTDPDYRQRLTERQVAWYASEMEPPT